MKAFEVLGGATMHGLEVWVWCASMRNAIENVALPSF